MRNLSQILASIACVNSNRTAQLYTVIRLIALALVASSLPAPAASLSDRWMTLIRYPSRAEVLGDLERFSPDLKPAVVDAATSARFGALIAQLDGQYRKLFPALMKNKALPDFVIVESDSVKNEFAYTSNRLGGTESYRGFIVVPDGPLKDPTQKAQVVGILSHELAHLFLNHHDVNSTILKMWRSETPDAALDEDTRRAARSYLENSAIAGGFTDENLDGVPLDEGLLLTAYEDATKKLKSRFPNETCVKDLLIQGSTASAFMARDFSYHSYSIQFSSKAEAAEVKAGLMAFESALIACSRSVGFVDDAFRYSLFPLGGHYVLAQEYLANLFKIDFSLNQHDEFKVIFDATRALHERMRQTWATAHLADVRWRSFEDEADEFAQAILKSLDLSQTDFVKSLLELFEPREPGLIARCFSAIRQNAEIPFGLFSDPHHGMCYRIQTVYKHANDPMFSAKP